MLLSPLTSCVLVTMWVLPVLLFSGGCGGREADEAPEPILRDAYSLYILDPTGFEIVDLEFPSPKEFLVLESGGVEISFGVYHGAYLTDGAVESDIATFALETIQNENWLPGVNRWMLDGSEVTIGERWYYNVTLLVRRDPGWSGRLNSIQRIAHQREFDNLPDNEDRIVRLYYSIREADLYIFTLTGPAEDVVVMETDVRRLLASVRLSATEAVGELDFSGMIE